MKIELKKRTDVNGETFYWTEKDGISISGSGSYTKSTAEERYELIVKQVSSGTKEYEEETIKSIEIKINNN